MTLFGKTTEKLTDTTKMKSDHVVRIFTENGEKNNELL